MKPKHYMPELFVSSHALVICNCQHIKQTKPYKLLNLNIKQYCHILKNVMVHPPKLITCNILQNKGVHHMKIRITTKHNMLHMVYQKPTEIKSHRRIYEFLNTVIHSQFC